MSISISEDSDVWYTSGLRGPPGRLVAAPVVPVSRPVIAPVAKNTPGTVPGAFEDMNYSIVFGMYLGYRFDLESGRVTISIVSVNRRNTPFVTPIRARSMPTAAAVVIISRISGSTNVHCTIIEPPTGLHTN